MKRSALARRAPLVSSSVLQRRSGFASAPLRAARTRQSAAKAKRSAGIPAKVRAALKARSDGMCEIAAVGCDGRATDASHRLGVKMGGRQGAAAVRHHRLSQLLHSCAGCHHGQIHAYPANAYWHGWMLRENEDPTAVPALYRGLWVLLDDHGGVTRTDKTTATDLAEGESL